MLLEGVGNLKKLAVSLITCLLLVVQLGCGAESTPAPVTPATDSAPPAGETADDMGTPAPATEEAAP